jgi:hypothetical protein
LKSLKSLLIRLSFRGQESQAFGNVLRLHTSRIHSSEVASDVSRKWLRHVLSYAKR